MNLGSIGIAASVAGSPLSQTRGAEADRVQHESTNHARQANADRQAASAAGIGTTAQDEQTSDRDADGRRLWELNPSADERGGAGRQPSESAPAKDPTGERGTRLDLSG